MATAEKGFNCIFCHGKSPDPKISKEHLWSVPLCAGFGIDRATTSAWDPTRPQARPIPLDQVEVRIACRSCNSGWMSELERRMGQIGWDWYRKKFAPLRDSDVLDLEAWAVKSYIVWAAYAGGIRRFGHDGDPKWAVPPPATAGRLLYEGDWEGATSSMTIGWGRIGRASVHAWAFGNPKIGRKVPSTGFLRGSGALRLNLSLLQILVVDSVLWPNTVRLPPRISPIRSGTSFMRLPLVDPDTRVDSVVVGV